MADRVTEKILNRISLGYGSIVAIVNYLGFLLAQAGDMPIMENESYRKWTQFMTENSTIITVLSVFSFVIPVVLILIYRLTSKTDRISRFICVPFVFSAIGILGWILSFCMECCCLIIAKVQYGIQISEIILGSLLNILQEAIFIFTLAFLILDFVHRKFVLPRIFPEGNLSKYNVPIKPSTRFIVHVFYLSVCIFPIFFLVSSLITYATNYEFSISINMFTVIGCIIVLSVIIMWMFCDYFNNPLKKLKLGAEKVKAGDYSYHVDIVSNDTFGDLSDTFNDMISSLDEKSKKIQAIQDSIIRGMAVMVESRDNSTGGHINRTSDCVKVFVNNLVKDEKFKYLTPEFCNAVIKAAPMHDLGKIAVDDAVLRKPGKFTDEEYEKMKKHSSEGARIVESVLSQTDDEQFKRIAINVAHYHHEKWNGAGYPEKISGGDIPLEARIMALADVFDALVSKRCYKESFTYDKAFEIIEESLGTHFDPDLGKIFISCREDLQNLYESY